MPEGNPYDPDWTEGDSDDLFGEREESDLDEATQEDQDFGEAMDEMLSAYEPEVSPEANAEFTEKYGFVHECHCAEDWAKGNLGVVSMCYLDMVVDAMGTLEKVNLEIKELKRENARLRIDSAS